MNVRSSQRGAGTRPRAAWYASTMRSTGFVRPSRGGGSVTAASGSGGSQAVPENAKPSSHTAPSSIHRRRTATASSGSGGPSLGMRNSGSVLVTRAMSSLDAESRATRPAVPESPPARMASRVFIENPPCRASPR